MSHRENRQNQGCLDCANVASTFICPFAIKPCLIIGVTALVIWFARSLWVLVDDVNGHETINIVKHHIADAKCRQATDQNSPLLLGVKIDLIGFDLGAILESLLLVALPQELIHLDVDIFLCVGMLDL